MKKYLVTLLILASFCFPKVSNAYFGGEPFGMSPFGIAKFGIGAFGESAVSAGIWDGFGLTFLKQYDTNQSSLDADTSSGSPTATFTASRGSTTPATTIETYSGLDKLVFVDGDYVDLGAVINTFLGKADTFSVYIKFKADVTSGNDLLFASSVASTDRMFIGLVSDVLTCGIYTGSFSSKNVAFTDTASTHQVIFSNTNETITAYLDGVELTGSGTNPATTGDALAVIANRTIPGDGTTFNGDIYEVAIYNTVLTSEQRTSVFAGSPPTGTIANYDFSDDSGPELVDTLATYDGTISGAIRQVDGNSYVTLVTSDDTARWTTGYYAQNGVYTAGPGLLLEGASTNMLSNSYEFDDANWAKSNITITADEDPGPSNISNASADTLTASAGNGTCLQAETAGSSTYTFSIWLKRKTGTGNIDITVDGGSTWTTKTLTSAWKRFELTQAAVTNPSAGVRIVTSADAVYAWGAQLEDAAFPSSLIPTTTAALTRNEEILEYVIADNRTAATESVVVAFRQDHTGQVGGLEYLTDTDTKSRYTRYSTGNDFRVASNATDSVNSRINDIVNEAWTPYQLMTVGVSFQSGTSPYIAGYFDGVADGTNETSDDFTVNAWGTNFQVGANNVTGQNFFGIIHAVAFFDNALTAAEHAEVYDILN